jgi:hypothetical protein
LRGDRGDIGDHHKKRMGKGNYWSIKFGLFSSNITGLWGRGMRKESRWRYSHWTTSMSCLHLA